MKSAAILRPPYTRQFVAEQHVARIESHSILATCCKQQATWQLFDITQGASNKLPTLRLRPHSIYGHNQT